MKNQSNKKPKNLTEETHIRRSGGSNSSNTGSINNK